MYIFFCIAVEDSIINSHMNGFSRFPSNLFAILVYYSEVEYVCIGMVVGHTVLVNSTGDMTAVFFAPILQTSAGLTYVGKVTTFFWVGPFVNSVLFKVWWDFLFGVHKDGLKGVGSFEDDLYTGLSKNSYEIFTEARNIWDGDEDIFIDF